MSSQFLETVRQKARGVMDRMAGPTTSLNVAPKPAPAPAYGNGHANGQTNGHGPTRYLDYNQVREVEDTIDEAIPMLEGLREFVEYHDRREIDATLAKLKRWSERLAALRNNTYR